LVGTGAYAVVANGAVDSYSLSFSGGALTSLLSSINNGTPLRLVMTADTASTAATWAGFGNATLPGPTLEFTTVPEPSTCLLIGLTTLTVGAAVRRRNTGTGSV
jgi:hypothetical protein